MCASFGAGRGGKLPRAWWVSAAEIVAAAGIGAAASGRVLTGCGCCRDRRQVLRLRALSAGRAAENIPRGSEAAAAVDLLGRGIGSADLPAVIAPRRLSVCAENMRRGCSSRRAVRPLVGFCRAAGALTLPAVAVPLRALCVLLPWSSCLGGRGAVVA